jgi:hypothetical protein
VAVEEEGEECFALHPLVIPLSCEVPVGAAEQELRRPPPFLQTVSGQLQQHLFLPFSFCRFLSKMQTLALQCSFPRTTPNRRAFGQFEEPDHKVLAGMDLLDSLLFQREISACVWEARRVEWWFITKERAFHRRKNTGWRGFDAVPLDLANFPHTQEGFSDWMLPQGGFPLLQERSTKFDNGVPETSDAGESASFELQSSPAASTTTGTFPFLCTHSIKTEFCTIVTDPFCPHFLFHASTA